MQTDVAALLGGLREAHRDYIAELEGSLHRFDTPLGGEEPSPWTPRQVAGHVLESEATFGRWLGEATGQWHRIRGKLVRHHTASEVLYRTSVLFQWVEEIVQALTSDDLSLHSPEYAEMLDGLVAAGLRTSEANPDPTVANLVRLTMDWHLRDHAGQLGRE